MKTLLSALLSTCLLLPALAAETFLPSFTDLPPQLQYDLCEAVRGMDAADFPSMGGRLVMQEIDLIGDRRKECVYRYEGPDRAEGKARPPLAAAYGLPRHLPLSERRYICDAEGRFLYVVPALLLHGERSRNCFAGEAGQLSPATGGGEGGYVWARWTLAPQRASLYTHIGAEDGSVNTLHIFSDASHVDHSLDTAGLQADAPTMGEYCRSQAQQLAAQPLAPDSAQGAASRELTLYELLTQEEPRWRAAGEPLPAEAQEAARRWTQEEAARSLDSLMGIDPAAQPELELVALSGSGLATFDVRNTGDKTVAVLPLAADTLMNYSLCGDTSLQGSSPELLYTSTRRCDITPPLLLQAGQGYRQTESFGFFVPGPLGSASRLWMRYDFGLDDINALAREARHPRPHTAKLKAFWQQRWAEVKDILAPGMRSLPMELPPDFFDALPEGGRPLMDLQAAVPEPGAEGALRLRFAPRVGVGTPALPLPDEPGRAARYTLVVTEADGQEHHWRARATPQPAPAAEREGARSVRELVVLPPSPEARAALARPVTLRLRLEQGGQTLCSLPLHALPAYFTRRLPGPDIPALRELGADKGDILPVVGEAAEPELILVSLDAEGRASCRLNNSYGQQVLCLPRAGTWEAAPAYCLHLWDAKGRETRLPARGVHIPLPLGGYAATQCVLPGRDERVDIDFPPLTREQRLRSRRVAVSIDFSRCEGADWRLPAAPKGAPEPVLSPPLMGEQRELDEAAWLGLGNGLAPCHLRLLSLDRETGEAHVELRNLDSMDARAFFAPGTSWGDGCFTLRVKDAEGREYAWPLLRQAYFRNYPRVRGLEGEETLRLRMDFDFDEPESLCAGSAEQAAFLSALRRPGSQLRLDYHMSQGCLLSVFAFTDAANRDELAHAENLRASLARSMRADWQEVESLVSAPPLTPPPGPGLSLLSVDGFGHALCRVDNSGGKEMLRLPRPGRAEADLLYWLHLVHEDGSVHSMCSLGGNERVKSEYARWLCVLPGESALLELDFALKGVDMASVRQLVVSVEPAEAAPEAGRKAPAMRSESLSLHEGQWEGLGGSKLGSAAYLELRSLDMQTGEAVVDILAARHACAFFKPGMLWGDSCFALCVKDGQGRVLRWRIERGYDKNYPAWLAPGASARLRLDFGFDEETRRPDPREDLAAFLAALRRPGAELLLEYSMAQGTFLSAFGSHGPDGSFDAARFERLRRLMLRGARSCWHKVETLQQEDPQP